MDVSDALIGFLLEACVQSTGSRADSIQVGDQKFSGGAVHRAGTRRPALIVFVCSLLQWEVTGRATFMVRI